MEIGKGWRAQGLIQDFSDGAAKEKWRALSVVGTASCESCRGEGLGGLPRKFLRNYPSNGAFWCNPGLGKRHFLLRKKK